MEKLEQLRNLHRISCEDGNWNYSPYNHGMSDGIEIALAILEDRDPVFKQRPEKWLEDIKKIGGRME